MINDSGQTDDAFFFDDHSKARVKHRFSSGPASTLNLLMLLKLYAKHVDQDYYLQQAGKDGIQIIAAISTRGHSPRVLRH